MYKHLCSKFRKHLCIKFRGQKPVTVAWVFNEFDSSQNEEDEDEDELLHDVFVPHARDLVDCSADPVTY